MDPTGWLQKAVDELVELEPVAEGDPADAWRAVALIARLLGSPSGLLPPAALVQRLPELLRIAGLPDPQMLLDRVVDELDSEADPAGPLFDALLDIDDTVGVLTTSGESEKADDLAQRAAALVSLRPARLIALGPFAQMRLQTVREGTTVGLLWTAIVRASAALVEPLPAPMPTNVRVETFPRSGTTQVHAEVSLFRIPEVLHRAAAASGTAEAVELETRDTELRAWVYCEQGRMRLECRSVGAGPLTAALIAERVKDGRELSRVVLDVEISGSTVYVDLGPWAGPENVLHRLIASTGLESSDVRILLTVSNG